MTQAAAVASAAAAEDAGAPHQHRDRRRLLQQLGRATVHRQLRLELPDPQPRRTQLLTLHRAKAGQLAAVNQLLPPPRVDRLIADFEQPRDLGDRLARCHQIECPPTRHRPADLFGARVQARLDEEWTNNKPYSDSPLNQADEDDGHTWDRTRGPPACEWAAQPIGPATVRRHRPIRQAGPFSATEQRRLACAPPLALASSQREAKRRIRPD